MDEKIKALTTREQCREKLPIFFGSRENYLHGFREVLANAVDEINNHYSRGAINITLGDDLKTITVSDSGRGIPIEGITDGKPNCELLFETLFAGTNYENNERGKVAVGTNGVGTTVLNYTSELFRVVSYKNGKKYSISYKNGGNRDGEVIEAESPNKNLHGSVFSFRLDSEVYTRVKYSPEEIKNIVRRTAATAKKIIFNFIFNKEKTTFSYPDLKQYFDETVTNITAKPVFGRETAYNRENEVNKIEILFCSSSEPIQESYLNHNWLPENGSIHDGIIQGLRLWIQDYCKEKKIIDKKSTITAKDIEDSVSYIASVLSTNVEYANQTKLSTNKKLYFNISREYIKSLLEAYQAEQQKEFDKFIKHIVQVNKFNNKNTEAKKKLKKKLNEKVDGIGNRVDKLVDCSIHGEESELFICEGNSALGSIVTARDGKYQAAYPLRGKILNCLKADYAAIFKNEVILDLIKTLGCGIQADKKNKDLESYDKSKLRFGKIVVATDADADGEQISSLIITMFYRLIPNLIEDGRIYIAKTPLYEVKLEDDSMIYIYSEAEKEQKLADIKVKYTMSRVKGLGELDAETMSYTAMDSKTRVIDKITVNDAEKMKDMIEMFMGIEIGPRKEFIENNLHNYIDLTE